MSGRPMKACGREEGGRAGARGCGSNEDWQPNASEIVGVEGGMVHGALLCR